MSSIRSWLHTIGKLVNKITMRYPMFDLQSEIRTFVVVSVITVGHGEYVTVVYVVGLEENQHISIRTREGPSESNSA